MPQLFVYHRVPPIGWFGSERSEKMELSIDDYHRWLDAHLYMKRVGHNKRALLRAAAAAVTCGFWEDAAQSLDELENISFEDTLVAEIAYLRTFIPSVDEHNVYISTALTVKHEQ